MNFIQITLTLFILNGSIATKRQTVNFQKTLIGYAQLVGVDLKIKVIKKKERYCLETYPDWKNDRYKLYDCLRARFTKSVPGEYTMFVIKPPQVDVCCTVGGGTYKADIGGGLGIICAEKVPGISLVIYKDYRKVTSQMTGVHELMHNLGANHQSIDKHEVMYASPSFDEGFSTIGDSTKEDVKNCLQK